MGAPTLLIFHRLYSSTLSMKSGLTSIIENLEKAQCLMFVGAPDFRVFSSKFVLFIKRPRFGAPGAPHFLVNIPMGMDNSSR